MIQVGIIADKVDARRIVEVIILQPPSVGVDGLDLGQCLVWVQNDSPDLNRTMIQDIRDVTVF